MMTATGFFLARGLVVAALAVGVQAEPPQDDRIYGRVETRDGDVFEGFIHWDKNEGSWADILHGSKPRPAEHVAQAEELDGRDGERDRERRRSVEILGLTISWDDDDNPGGSTISGVRFGHLRSLEVVGRDEALLVLKSGEEVAFRRHSTDIGTGIRGIVVEDPGRGRTDLEWNDLERIEFMAVPEGARSRAGSRLWGTVRTRGDRAFTGYVTWDMDEIFQEDVLDGDERGRDREIPFANIVSIERRGSRSARVVLANGEEMTLDGSNDVNSSNRGILVVDPALGEVKIEWEDFGDVVFNPVPEPVGYDHYDGGDRLYGTVVTEDGRELTGHIRWDNDEEFTWEILDGDLRDLEFDIEFAFIESIEKDWARGSVVTLRDGRSFELEDSNDVDERNNGIFVTPEGGETRLVRWRDFEKVTFQRR